MHCYFLTVALASLVEELAEDEASLFHVAKSFLRGSWATNGAEATNETNETAHNVYDEMPGWDFDGEDSAWLPTTDIKSIQEACDARFDCVGYNNRGVLKRLVPHSQQWIEYRDGPYITFYKKKMSYVKYMNQDSPGGNLIDHPYANETRSGLQDICDANPHCIGFTNRGWLKGSISAKGTWTDTESSLYVKLQTKQTDGSSGGTETVA